MAIRNVFISYDYTNDRHYKNLLVAWSANTQFDFNFIDLSADVSVNSVDAISIKRVLSRYINEATYFLVIIGQYTHRSAWVSWEIDKAYELNRRIIAVKTDRANETPESLYGIGANWAMSFTFNAIANAIDNA